MVHVSVVDDVFVQNYLRERLERKGLERNWTVILWMIRLQRRMLRRIRRAPR